MWLIIDYSTKVFSGHFKIIQTNAIQSWRVFSSDVESILFDDASGLAEIAAQVETKHIPNVAKKRKRDTFKAAYCYINAGNALAEGCVSIRKGGALPSPRMTKRSNY